MHIHVQGVEENIEEEFGYAEKFIHSWSEERQEKMEQVVDGKVASLYG